MIYHVIRKTQDRPGPNAHYREVFEVRQRGRRLFDVEVRMSPEFLDLASAELGLEAPGPGCAAGAVEAYLRDRLIGGEDLGDGRVSLTRYGYPSYRGKPKYIADCQDFTVDVSSGPV